MTTVSTQRTLITRSQGAGKDLVLLHGWGMNSGAFSEFITTLASDYRITLIDLPGFGENADIVPEPYTLEALCAAIEPMLPSQCVIVGWSLGGLIAQQLAVQHSNKVAALITMASTPKFEACHGWNGIEPNILRQFESQLERDYEKTVERFLAIQAMGSDTARKDIKTIRSAIQQYPAPSVLALRDGLSLLSNVDLRDVIGRISVPTLRLYGRLDSLVPTSVIDRIHELQPEADSVVLCHASHAPFISHPQQTHDIIDRFVQNLA